MGMSSSQARLLTLTARMHDIEYRAQRIEAQKLQMANESRRAYEEYLDALDATKIQYKAINSDGSITFKDATLRTLENGVVSSWEGEASNTPFLLKNGMTNEIYVTPEFADEFHIVDGEEIEVGPLDDFLESKDCTKEQDKMKIGGETDYSNIISVTPIQNTIIGGTPAGEWGISGAISPTTITPAGNPTYNIAGTLSSIDETKGIALDKGGVTDYFTTNVSRDYRPAGLAGTSGIYIKGIAENITLLYLGAYNKGSSDYATDMDFSNTSSRVSNTLSILTNSKGFTVGTAASQGLYNLGKALDEILNSDNHDAYSAASHMISDWLNNPATPYTNVNILYDALRTEMSNYNISLPSNYSGMTGNNLITDHDDYTKSSISETTYSNSNLSKNDLITLITFNALQKPEFNPDNLTLEEIMAKVGNVINGLSNNVLVYLAYQCGGISNNLDAITSSILVNNISAETLNHDSTVPTYPNPHVSSEDHFSIVDGEIESVNCASENDILTKIAYDVWSKNNSIAESPAEYLATLTDKWNENELASLYSYFGDGTNAWDAIMTKIANGQDITEFLSKYSELDADNIHFDSEDKLSINTTSGDPARVNSASVDDMQKMLAWSIYNSLSDAEKASTTPENIYNNIKNNSGDYLELDEDQLASIFEKYNDTTKWNDIVDKIKSKDNSLLSDTSIEWIDSSYEEILHNYNINFIEPAPGTNPKVTVPTLNDILWNVETALKNLGYDDEDIERVKNNIQLTYSADNDFNNKSLAYINDIVCDFLNDYTNSSKASATSELMNRLKMGTSVLVPDSFYSGHDFARATSSKSHNVQWGKTPIEWIDDPDPDHWHWVNDQTYKDAIDEYYFLKSLEGNKFKVIWDEDLLNSSEFVSNWLTLNEGYLLEFDPETRGMVDTNVATNTKLQEVADEKDLKKAEAKYEADMKRIDMKDRRYDTQLAALDNERNAVKQEMETVKTVAKDNVDRTFRLFS